MLAPMSDSYRYTAGQRALHWSMALIIFVAIALGVYAAMLPSGVSSRSELLYIHKSLGMLALVLVFARLVLRFAKGEPRWRVALPKAIRGAAHAAHGSLYLLMLAMPVSGYVLSAAGGHPVPFFGLFQWPIVVEKAKAMSEAAGVPENFFTVWYNLFDRIRFAAGESVGLTCWSRARSRAYSAEARGANGSGSVNSPIVQGALIVGPNSHAPPERESSSTAPRQLRIMPADAQ